MIAINLQKYGDFDSPYTVATLMGPAGMSKEVAREIINEANEMFKDTDDATPAIAYLQSWGFETVPAFDVTIGGNL